MATKKIALFIDADNVSAKFGKQIIDELSRRGEIFIRRIYGNWGKISLHGWNECILNFSLRAVQQTDFVTGKNATDMSLTIDAMDVLYGGRADVFALVSNDSDFTPLAIRLREGGMNVVGLGNGHAANAFRMACSEFIDLDAPAQEKISEASVTKPVKKKSSSKENSPVQLNLFAEDKVVELKTSQPEKISPKVVKQVQPVVKISPVAKVVSLSERQQLSERDTRICQLHELLREVAKIHGDAYGFTPLCWAGQTLRKKNLGFGIKQVGYSSFQAFVKAFPKLYELIHRKTGENFCYRCRPKVSEEKIQSVHDGLREAVKIHGDAQGFVNLCWTGAFLKDKNLDVKNFGYVTLQNFIEAFSELYELQKVGTLASFRCKMNTTADSDKLDQLHDILRESAEIHADDNGFSLLNHAGAAIKNKRLGFGIKDFGYRQLRDFVSAFPELYETAQDDAGKHFRYRPRQKFLSAES